MQGLSDTLADVGEGMDETPAEEYAMMLEMTMADRPSQPHPPTFSWNAGMVLHMLKSDPVLRELEHMQVGSSGTAYLFFYESRVIGAFTRILCMQSGLTWRRLFQSGFHAQPTLPLASFLLHGPLLLFGWHNGGGCFVVSSFLC